MAEPSSSSGTPPFRIEPASTHGNKTTLRLSGRFLLRDGAEIWQQMQAHTTGLPKGSSIAIDMRSVELVDGGAMALLVHTRTDLVQRGVSCELVDAAPHVQDIIHLYRGDVRVGRKRRRRPQGTLDQIGLATRAFLLEFKLALAFLGQGIVSMSGVFRDPRSANWRETFPTAERAGADAVPIVLLINFLVGLVMAFQSAPQLQRFGANIFVADLIGISMTRELGPLMTAIVVCGRSGAAFAAEIGSMKVNEEIDALRTMGFGPMRSRISSSSKRP
jgi:phospholipid/cholesterol/gamma-HCH transport system permease protein